MANWMDTYDAVFFISIGTMVVGLVALMIRFCIKSKCEHFSLCFGLITIDRRVDLEVQEEMHKIDRGIEDNDEIPDFTNLVNHSDQSKKRPSITGGVEKV